MSEPLPSAELVERSEAEIVAEAFDPAFYLATYPDVASYPGGPLQHFLDFGWRELRDPNAEFSTRAYVDANPDVFDRGVNPLVHCLTSPRRLMSTRELRLGFRYEVIEGAIPMEIRLESFRRPVRTDPAARLDAALATGREGLRRLHVTFSHDDYTAGFGGVPITLQRESAGVAALGRDHLHLFPARPWQLVRTPQERGQLGVIWNGRRVGIFSPRTITAALRRASAGPAATRSFAIHSLLGHDADETADLLAALDLQAGYFWLHDFASLCAGFHLMRDDVEDCAAPPPDSAACGICLFGPWRRRHLEAHERLFRRLRLTVASPSEPTLTLWRRAWDFPTAGEVVAPHARLVRPRPDGPARDGPFRLVYAGLTVPHKGWRVFRELALRAAEDPRYAFLHLGASGEDGLPVEFHEVTATPERPEAMREALAAHRPDAVLVWPLCRETFSFTTHEAAAAGAAVVTGPDSGNVAAFVDATGLGVVLRSEEALLDAFRSGEILSLARDRRAAESYDLAFSGLTADLVAA